jgi:hypothetical protein
MPRLSANPDPRDGFVLDRAEEFMGEFMPNPRRHSRRMTFVRVFNRLHSQWDPEVLIHERVKVAGSATCSKGSCFTGAIRPLARMIDTTTRMRMWKRRCLLKERPNGPS